MNNAGTESSDVLDGLNEVVELISAELQLSEKQVAATIELLDGGNTLPFIARYRKEVTRGLDETQLRLLEDHLHRERELQSRKQTILKSLTEQEVLTPELKRRVIDCRDKHQLEIIYLPFKPKRRTRATTARDRGLQPLADLLLAQETIGRRRQDILLDYVDADKEVPDIETALAGASDIVAEVWSEQEEIRSWLLEEARDGWIVSSVKRGKKDPESKFAGYFDYREPIRRVPSHRFLALKRGEAEGVLNLRLELEDETVLRRLQHRLLRNPRFEFHRDLQGTVEDSYQRLMKPAVQSFVFQQLKERADEEAIGVFSKNLRELLLAPPAGARVTLGIDPGFRTGCKVAVVDATGKFIDNTTIYPTPPRNDLTEAEKVLVELIGRHRVELIAIGNGTASRETDRFVTDLLRTHELDVTKVMVNEAGASIYSASEYAAQEYPGLDVTVRGAISIAHRLQDPLSELVKIDPKSIGVGQYQHDVNATLLKKALEREVESCVSTVGVELNQASVALLSRVAGIGPKLAENIVAYREKQGEFKSRRELLKVAKLGKKAFEQAAGFLRIGDGASPLDRSAVHPESYYVVEKMASAMGCEMGALIGNSGRISQIEIEQFVDEQVGLPTLRDILEELAKPGRDPRRDFQVARFDEAVQEIEDLREGMVLEGTVTNVTNFGAFVDVGVHQDGLVHISELDNSFVQDPNEIVSVGDVVRVKVLEVDAARRRIALSRKRA